MPPDLPGDTPAQRMALGMAGSVAFTRGAPTAQVLDMLRRSVGEDGTAPGRVAGLDVGDPLQWMIQAKALDEAETLAEERMSHARATGDEALFAATQNAMAWLLSLRGDLRGSTAAFRLGLGSPAVSPFHARAHHPPTCCGRRSRSASSTRRRPSSSGLGMAASRTPRPRPGEAPHPHLAWAACSLAEGLAVSGRVDEATSIVTQLRDRAELLELRLGAGAYGSVLARITADLAGHERAVAVLAASPFRFEEARARLAYGEALRRAGRRVEARAAAAHARQRRA